MSESEEKPRPKPPNAGKGRPKGVKNRDKGKVFGNFAQSGALKLLKEKVKGTKETRFTYECRRLLQLSDDNDLKFAVIKFLASMASLTPSATKETDGKSDPGVVFLPEELSEEEWSKKALAHMNKIEREDTDPNKVV